MNFISTEFPIYPDNNLVWEGFIFHSMLTQITADLLEIENSGAHGLYTGTLGL